MGVVSNDDIFAYTCNDVDPSLNNKKNNADPVTDKKSCAWACRYAEGWMAVEYKSEDKTTENGTVRRCSKCKCRSGSERINHCKDPCYTAVDGASFVSVSPW